MPGLENKPYDENAGELFPFHSELNNNTRARAMYFFHNSLGEQSDLQSLAFVNQVQVGGGNSGFADSGWTGKQSDIETWPITDVNGETIEKYSDGSACYFYRIRVAAQNFRWHINHPPGWDLSKGNVETQDGVSSTDKEIYKRYVDAFEYTFDGNTTKSIRLELDRPDETDPPSEEMVIEVPLTYTDPNAVERICDGSYDQTATGSSNNVGYHCRSLPTKVQWFERIGGAGDDAQGGEGQDGDGVWTWNATVQYNEDVSCGKVTFNRKPLDGNSDGGGTETESGQFIVGDEISDYQAGDFLYLEANDNENFFHQRLVRVIRIFSASSGKDVAEIETQDSAGFEDESVAELFTITKLTHAPKLKIEYTIPNSSSQARTIVDDVEDVGD